MMPMSIRTFHKIKSHFDFLIGYLSIYLYISFLHVRIFWPVTLLINQLRRIRLLYSPLQKMCEG